MASTCMTDIAENIRKSLTVKSSEQKPFRPTEKKLMRNFKRGATKIPAYKEGESEVDGIV